jgi:ClpP class serine protease
MTLATLPNRARFAPAGLLAVEPSAFGLDFLITAGVGAEPFRLVADDYAAVVDISGPLTHAGWMFQSYASIRDRVSAALASSAHCVILKLDSPGGEVAGAFDLARALRTMAEAAGKDLIAYTDSQACSSAYALATSAKTIIASDTAVVGSIGVINTAVDTTKADAAQGLSFFVLASGARKADGNPHVAMSEAALAAMQQSIDDAAGVFFNLVDSRRDIDSASLQAATFVGERARAQGLIDQVMSWDQLLGALASGAIPSQSAKPMLEKRVMADKDEDNKDPDAVHAALVTASNSDDPKKAARAKKALAAYEREDAKAEDEEKKPDAKAEGDENKDDEKDKDAKAIAAVSASALAKLNSELVRARSQISELQARNDANDRAAFFATRPDLTTELLKELEGLSLAQAKAIVAKIQPTPAVASMHVDPAASATRPETTANAISANPQLDAAFGLVQYDTGVSVDGAIQSFGVRTVKAPNANTAVKGS